MSRRKKRKGKKLLFLTLLLVCGLTGWFFWNLRSGAVSETQEITIAAGASAQEVAGALAARGLIRSSSAFIGYAWLTGNRGRIQAGDFRIPADADVAEIIGILTAGARRLEYTVRIIEGWTLSEIDEYLAKEDIFKAGVFLSAAKNVRQQCDLIEEACRVISSLPSKVNTPEGYLFPDTYRLYSDASPQDLIEKMLLRLHEKTSSEEFQKRIQASGFKFHEAVTMASVIEAEVPHEEDRQIVAGLLWKRIAAGMPLQVDATVNYITGKHTASASAEDLKINSPYNTYLYPDLPPGPIGNPGMGALMAAVSPKDSPYWFYLSAKDGATIFSRTFAEHVAAKERYLR